jgi:hypothetical protein
MGKNPLYPFAISAPVAEKLGFVHAVVRETGGPRFRDPQSRPGDTLPV